MMCGKCGGFFLNLFLLIFRMHLADLNACVSLGSRFIKQNDGLGEVLVATKIDHDQSVEVRRRARMKGRAQMRKNNFIISHSHKYSVKTYIKHLPNKFSFHSTPFVSYQFPFKKKYNTKVTHLIMNYII